MSPVIKSTVETTTTTTYRFSGKEILSLVPDKIWPSDVVTIEFCVPSGGDYSGMAVPISEEDPVVVTAKRYTREGDR